MLYQFQGIGEDEESSMDIVGNDNNDDFVYFAPHPLRNLAPIDEVDSLSPIMGTFNFPRNFSDFSFRFESS